jgi:hypothetical protein
MHGSRCLGTRAPHASPGGSSRQTLRRRRAYKLRGPVRGRPCPPSRWLASTTSSRREHRDRRRCAATKAHRPLGQAPSVAPPPTSTGRQEEARRTGGASALGCSRHVRDLVDRLVTAWQVLRVMQLRCDLPLSQDQGHARRPLDAWHLPWRVVMAHRGGEADGVDVAGMPVAIALRYSDDEPSSPWTWILYLDERATDPQRAALEDIFTGQRGGDAATHFPWAWKPSKLVAVRAGCHRCRPHPPPPAAAHPQSRQRPHPGPSSRDRDGDLHDVRRRGLTDGARDRQRSPRRR